MCKEEKSEQDRAELNWLVWFQALKLDKPNTISVFFEVLKDFVDEYPDIASYLTLDDLHVVLLDEI